MKESKIYELWYSIYNGGDGSAGVEFFKNKIQAQKHQEKENENGEGWAEDCFGSLPLTIQDGKVSFIKDHWNIHASRGEKIVFELNEAPLTQEITAIRFNDLLEIEKKYYNLEGGSTN